MSGVSGQHLPVSAGETPGFELLAERAGPGRTQPPTKASFAKLANLKSFRIVRSSRQVGDLNAAGAYSRRQAGDESDRAHVHVLPFRKTAHVRNIALSVSRQAGDTREQVDRSSCKTASWCEQPSSAQPPTCSEGVDETVSRLNDASLVGLLSRLLRSPLVKLTG